MPWLNVPHLSQAKPAWCLPACVAMVAAYWQQPLLQDDVAHWLGTTGVGTPASRVQRLRLRGFEVLYRSGSLPELLAWIARKTPCILFVHTRELPYWTVGTPHAVVLAGLEADTAALFDPAAEPAPVLVPIGDLMLAWSYSDYTYAVLSAPG
jgi:ABC-type bacteriocin/lantibiotic exporter with double-glycine peptidase domain